MSSVSLKTRIRHKIDTAANWASSSLVPLEGELIIYKGDQPQIKIGDGTTVAESLPFIKAGSDTTIIAALTSGTKIGSISIDGVTTELYAPSTVAWDNITSKPSYYDGKAITSISRNGTTFTATHLDGTTSTFTQQDNNTTYSAGTGISLNGTALNIDNTVLTYNRYDTYATVGGYNLCYDTKECEGWAYSLATTTVTSQKEEYEGVKYIRFIRDSTEETSWKYCSNDRLDRKKLKSGTYYTVSFDVCSSVSGNVQLVGIMTESAQYNLAQKIEQIDTRVEAGVWKRVKMRFKTVDSISSVGLNSQVVYLSVPAVAPNSEIVFGRICVQEGVTPGEYTDYESFYTNITNNNINSYAPTLTGSGASGTWGIGISGNAATATALTTSAGSSTIPIYFSGGKPVQCSTTLGVNITGNAATASSVSGWKIATVDTDANTILTAGCYRCNSNMTNIPAATYGQLLVIFGGGDTIAQIYFTYTGPNVYVRTGNVVNNSSGTWTAWKRIWVAGDAVTGAVWN